MTLDLRDHRTKGTWHPLAYIKFYEITNYKDYKEF